jgi:hypothetical protein
MKGWGILAALLALLASRAVQGQSFSPPISPLLLRYGQTPRDRYEKFRIGAFWAKWDLPSYTVAGAGPTGGGLPVERHTEASALVEADYFLNDSLSIGGWWNQISGEDRQTARTDLRPEIASFDATFWDLHVTYYPKVNWTDGLSVQLGWNTLHQEVTRSRQLGGTKHERTNSSINLWLSKTQQVGSRGARHPIFIYGSLGYIPSPVFGNTNLLFGASVDLIPHLSLGGSAWLNDLEDLNVRWTVGLVGGF